MIPGDYRLKGETVSLFQKDDHHVASMIPSDAIITIPTGTTFNGDKLVEVIFDGNTVMMFAQDLRDRTVRV
jgi:hypothetical protein